MIPPPPRSTLFPYTTLFRSVSEYAARHPECADRIRAVLPTVALMEQWKRQRRGPLGAEVEADRKSTRLNSSHVEISYAVFCLKKKKKNTKNSKDITKIK